MVPLWAENALVDQVTVMIPAVLLTEVGAGRDPGEKLNSPPLRDGDPNCRGTPTVKLRESMLAPESMTNCRGTLTVVPGVCRDSEPVTFKVPPPTGVTVMLLGALAPVEKLDQDAWLNTEAEPA